jgi:hypothetical protein
MNQDQPENVDDYIDNLEENNDLPVEKIGGKESNFEFRGGPLGGQKRLVSRKAKMVVIRWPDAMRMPPGSHVKTPIGPVIWEWAYQRHGNLFILRAKRILGIIQPEKEEENDNDDGRTGTDEKGTDENGNDV